MRNTEVDAAVVMDSIIFVPFIANSLKTTLYFDRTKFRAPLMHMDRAESVKNEDFADFEALRYATRYHFLLNHEPLLHQDFSQHGVAVTQVLKLRGKDQAAAEQAFELIYRYILHFFNAHVKKEAASLAFLNRRPEENGASAGFLTFETRAAILPPPSEAEFMAMLQQPGSIGHAVLVYHEATRANPALRLFQESAINSLGYQLLQSGRTRDAIEVCQLNVEAYPESANVYDGLADAYEAEGNKAEAIRWAEKTIEVLGRESKLSEQRRAPIRQSAMEKLRRLKGNSN
jgi:tetratricopeptide (TPR) repeat protein